MKNFLKSALLTVLSVIATLGFAEVMMRKVFKSHFPWVYVRVPDSPTTNIPDSLLGWKGAEGKYMHGTGSHEQRFFEISILPDGNRRTSETPPTDSAGDIVFLGGSFTQGWQIDDSNTFAWKIQEALPNFNILNYGTIGYGTYQSLLVLEGLLPRLKLARVVVYGFISHHEFRNVADPDYLRGLKQYSRQGAVAVPFVTLNHHDQVVRHEPEDFPILPFSEYSAIINLIGKVYVDLSQRNRVRQKTAVTEKLLLQMAEISRKHGARYFVVLLDGDKRVLSHYKEFLEQSRIEFIDCAFPLSSKDRVAGRGHPNEAINARYADCILARLQKIIGVRK